MAERPQATVRHTATRILRTVGSLTMTVVCLGLLAVLVVWGTLYQTSHGTFAAQQRFFGSWLVAVHGVPLFPGVKTLIALLSINLLTSPIVRPRFSWRRIGLLLIHAGIAVLFFAAGFTHYVARESYLSLREGEESATSQSQREWELAVVEQGRGASTYPEVTVAADHLRPGASLSLFGGRVSGSVLGFYPNATPRYPPGRKDGHPVGVEPAAPRKEPAENVPATVLDLREPARQKIVLWGHDPVPLSVRHGGGVLHLTLRPRRIALPLRVTLIDFEKQDHPGTTVARDFVSRIRVRGEDIDRETVVSMNRPFRYRDYTFYQTSYSQHDGREASTFAIVKNRGRLLPYIASLIIIAGLFWHFAAMLARNLHRGSRRAKEGA